MDLDAAVAASGTLYARDVGGEAVHVVVEGHLPPYKSTNVHRTAPSRSDVALTEAERTALDQLFGTDHVAQDARHTRLFNRRERTCHHCGRLLRGHRKGPCTLEPVEGFEPQPGQRQARGSENGTPPRPRNCSKCRLPLRGTHTRNAAGTYVCPNTVNGDDSVVDPMSRAAPELEGGAHGRGAGAAGAANMHVGAAVRRRSSTRAASARRLAAKRRKAQSPARGILARKHRGEPRCRHPGCPLLVRGHPRREGRLWHESESESSTSGESSATIHSD